MDANRPHLYVNSKGYYVTRHSYSGSESFHFCARKYFLERVQGWSEKTIRSSTAFGTAVEKAVTYYHQHRLNSEAAVQEFIRLWAEHKDKPNYTYTKSDLDWNRLNLSGQEIVKLYAIRYPTFPYVVDDPSAFQVETNIEVFPGTKYAGIEFTSYIDLIASIKGSKEPIIIDMKTSGKDVPEYTVLDPQLRSYAWVKNRPNVAFLWFRKCGRTISKGDTVTLLEPYAGLSAGDDAIVAATDDFGLWITQNQQVVDELDAKFVGKSKAVESDRRDFIHTNTSAIPERCVTKQRVQFKQAIITPESAEDIGQAIKRDIIQINLAKENDFYPMQSGVRFPNEKCPMCAMRGICTNNAVLRDSLLVRKQMDEFDFGKDSE